MLGLDGLVGRLGDFVPEPEGGLVPPGVGVPSAWGGFVPWAGVGALVPPGVGGPWSSLVGGLVAGPLPPPGEGGGPPPEGALVPPGVGVSSAWGGFVQWAGVGALVPEGLGIGVIGVGAEFGAIEGLLELHCLISESTKVFRLTPQLE